MEEPGKGDAFPSQKYYYRSFLSYDIFQRKLCNTYTFSFQRRWCIQELDMFAMSFSEFWYPMRVHLDSSSSGSIGLLLPLLLLLGFNWTPPPPPPIYIITALTKQNKNLQEKSFITYQKWLNLIPAGLREMNFVRFGMFECFKNFRARLYLQHFLLRSPSTDFIH